MMPLKREGAYQKNAVATFHPSVESVERPGVSRTPAFHFCRRLCAVEGVANVIAEFGTTHHPATKKAGLQ
jgi:hypothetical protein